MLINNNAIPRSYHYPGRILRRSWRPQPGKDRLSAGRRARKMSNLWQAASAIFIGHLPSSKDPARQRTGQRPPAGTYRRVFTGRPELIAALDIFLDILNNQLAHHATLVNWKGTMKNNKYLWILVLGLTVAGDCATDHVPATRTTPKRWIRGPMFLNGPTHTDHTNLMPGPLETGQEVTQACLECHPDAASQVMSTAHWTWESKPIQLPGRDEPVTVGKKNQINNFCIGIQGNWQKCVTCHAGYGWEDETSSIQQPRTRSTAWSATPEWAPMPKATTACRLKALIWLRQPRVSAYPTRAELRQLPLQRRRRQRRQTRRPGRVSLYFPSASIDVHMGEHDFQCIDCHQTEDHNINGRSISVSLDNENQVYCTDCHGDNLHEDERLNAHLDTVACQTCHIPDFALEDPTKMDWNWSEAGQDIRGRSACIPQDQRQLRICRMMSSRSTSGTTA